VTTASLHVIHEGEGFAVIDKPAGLRSVPARGSDTDPGKHDSVQSRITHHWPDASGPLMVHRLDRETSGLMVIALERDTHRRLSSQFMKRRVGKSYTALVAGHWPEDDDAQPREAAIDLPLIVDWDRRPRQKVDFDAGRSARTLYRVLANESLTIEGQRHAVTRVAFRPLTGRTHQLRVHCAWPAHVDRPPGWRPTIIEQTRKRRDREPLAPTLPGGLARPILGDALYEGLRAPRLMLHAHTLAFWEPRGSGWLTFAAPCPF
jgi:tRNA pseudouridine32 synthase / 23S rRNA pseudouridine746 synthase